MPVRTSIADASGTQVTGLSPTLLLVASDGTERPAGTLRDDPVEDRYAAQVSLRTVGVPAGGHALVAVLDDGTERVLAEVVVR